MRRPKFNNGKFEVAVAGILSAFLVGECVRSYSFVNSIVSIAALEKMEGRHPMMQDANGDSSGDRSFSGA